MDSECKADSHFDKHHPSHRLREVFLILMLAASMLTLTSLINWHVHHVLSGWAYCLILAFAHLALLTPLLFIYVACVCYLHWHHEYLSGFGLCLKLIGAGLLYITLPTMIALTGGDGGFIGKDVSQGLVRLCDLRVNVWIILITLLLIGTSLITRLTWYTCVCFVRSCFHRCFRAANASRALVPYGGLIEPDTSSNHTIMPFGHVNVDDANRLIGCLAQFKIAASVVAKIKGPVITRYEIALAPGVKSSSVCARAQDMARALGTQHLRILEVIHGRAHVMGIEVPNQTRDYFHFSDLLPELMAVGHQALPMLLGKTITGDTKISDLEKLVHLLIAGTTGSGKSTLLKSLLLSLVSKHAPSELQMILIDPKKTEFVAWRQLPHLITPVVTDTQKAIDLLNGCVEEMERRERAVEQQPMHQAVFPKLVVVVDELSSLMWGNLTASLRNLIF